MPAKTPHYINISDTTVVRLQLVPAAYADAGLLTRLGISAGTGATFDPPTGKTVIGSGRLAAMQRGCFGVNLVYAKTPTKSQTAKVLVSPMQADSVFSPSPSIGIVGQKYNTFNILEARVPRRRTYNF